MFTILGYGIVAVIVLIAILAFFNVRAGRSWYHLFRTKAGQFGEYAEGVDPAGQMRQAAIDASAELANADKALMSCEAMQSKLKRQINGDTLAANRLRAQIKKKLESGTSETDPDIVSKAKQVAELEKAVIENTSQIELQNDIYRKTLNSANSAAKRINGAIQRADRLKIRLDIGAQMSNLTAMLSKYSPAAVNSKMASIDKFEEKANEQLDMHSASLKVMADRGYVDEEETEFEMTSEAADVLASIRSNLPILTPKTTPVGS